jgi:ubiquinone biosynthesis protein UbiJ
MLTTLAASIANHLLGGQPWLRERLLPFAGRTVELDAPPFRLVFTVAADGGLAQAADGVPPDASAVLGPVDVMDVLLQQHRAPSVKVRGDAAFAAAVAGVLSELRWDAEEDLSHILGDVAAHRLAGAARTFWHWQQKAALSLAQTATEYLTQERPLLASRVAVEQFNADVDALRDAVERLEKRVARVRQT